MPGLVASLSGLAGIDITQFVSVTANFTLQNVNTAQQAFNATTNGALQLLGNTAYALEGFYAITNTGITSHTWAVLFGGTATYNANCMIGLSGLSAAAAAPAAGSLQGYMTTPGSATVVTAASTSATENVTIFIEGRINTNAAGTFIPQLQLSAAPGGTQTMLAGSILRIWPLGPATVQVNGPWS